MTTEGASERTAGALVTVKGNPTPEELAVAVVALLGRAAAPEPAPRPPLSHWADRERLLRRALPHGPGAWRHAR